MTYQLEVSNNHGKRIAILGPFANILSARQAMLDHSNTVDFPDEEPFYCPAIRVVEGWFIGRTEYCIKLVLTHFKPDAARRLLALEAGGLDDEAPEGADELMEWLNKVYEALPKERKGDRI